MATKALPLQLNKGEGYCPCEPKDATHIQLHLPGPLPDRILPVIQSGPRKGTHCWTWNGSIDKPTLKPSVRTKTKKFLCHSFITDGKVQFLGDCTHEFADKTMELLEVDDFFSES